MENYQKRDKSVDIMRGIAIVIMVMGHIGIGIPSHDINFSIWYHAWHMPIFYIVSGYFFSRKSDMQTFIVKKAKSLLVPFFLWGLLNILFNYIQDGNWQNAAQTINDALFRKPTNAGIYYAGALWFLPALFWAEVIYKVLTYIVKNNILFYISTCLLGICGIIIERHNVFLPFALDAALVAIPFIALGELLKVGRQTKIVKELLCMRWYLFLAISIIIFILIFYNGEVNFRSGIYGNFIITYINASMAAILLWNFSRVVTERFKGNLWKVISDGLASIGRNSIIYLCLNQRIIYFVKPVISSRFNGTIFLNYLGLTFSLCVVLFVCYVIMYVFSGSEKLKYFIGK